MSTEIIAGPGPTSAPVSLVNTYNKEITPQTVSAEFVGTGAAADFLPCLSFYSQDGRLLGRFFPDTAVTAGDTAQVTFYPFRRGGSATTGGGIQFVTKPQSGGWLYIKTTSFIPGDSFGAGFRVDVTGGNDAVINVDDGTTFHIAFDDGAAEYHFAKNNMSCFLSTNESTSLVPGIWEADVGTANLLLKESTGFQVTLPASCAFTIKDSTPENAMAFADDGSGKTSLVVKADASPVSGFAVFYTANGYAVKLASAGDFEIQDSTGQPIFRVDQDGDLHGLTGKALTFDL